MDRITYLLLQYLREESTPAEQAELEGWLSRDPANRALLEELQDDATVTQGLVDLSQLDRETHGRNYQLAADRLRSRTALRPVQPEATGEATATETDAPAYPFEPPIRSNRRRYGIAAAVILLLGLATWWAVRTLSVRKSTSPVAKSTIHDVPAPATNRATLTLSGGQTVYLDSAATGTLADQGSAHVVKQASGQLAYQTSAAPLHHNELLYNTLANPRGSQVIHLTLADGTKVWLNAESSIRYPAVFGETDRTVEMTGEAYFEVTADAARPFRVKEEGTTIDVLGTAFNVNTYGNEPIGRVTLVGGKVRVNRGNALVLAPGQQAEVRESVWLAPEPDLEQVLAWKNGLFAFHGADLQTVMRELARWYDVDVRYAGAIPGRTFGGEIGKTLTLNQVLKVLAGQRIHYTIDGKTLTIRP